MENQTPTVNIFEKAVKKAGKKLVRDFGEIENLQIQSEKIKDFISRAKIIAENQLLETLQYYYPNFSYYVLEKEIKKGKDNETISIKPLEGTFNFLHGIPIFSISISKQINDEIIESVIYNPSTNDFFWASKGAGAWCNNSRLRVSKRQNISECLISIGNNFFDSKNADYLKTIYEISKQFSGLRIIGSTSLSLTYIASGKFDAFCEKNINSRNFGAEILLVREAGGKISEVFEGVWKIDSDSILASNTIIHEEFQKKLGISL